MSNIELKNCPFCGSEAKAFKWGMTAEVEIVCQNEDCGVMQSGIVSVGDNESDEEAYERAYQIAKERWNRRAENG
mgnify:FL=1